MREYVRTCSLSPSSNADIKNAWTYTSIYLYTFMVFRGCFMLNISVSFINDVEFSREKYFTGCPEQIFHQNLEIFYCIDLRFALLNTKTLKVVFVTATHFSIFKFGQPWWLEKCPDDIIEIYQRVLKHVVFHRVRNIPCSGIQTWRSLSWTG